MDNIILIWLLKGDLPLKISWTFQSSSHDSTNSQKGVQISKIGQKSSVLTIESLSGEHTGNYTVKLLLVSQRITY